MQQGGGGGGGGGSQSQYREITPAAVAVSTHMVVGGIDQSQQPVEAASPISSRPPATGNLEELMRLSAAAAVGGGSGSGSGLGDEDEGGGGGVGGGNRWPRQETLALLKIRSDMDAIFRDATIKGPLWEDVSRKLGELGYKRSGKKCKEKFENVHKYYKRTKEGRAGRQDGKSYKFFSQLEALHNTTTTHVSSSSAMPVTPTSLDVAPVSVGIPMPISSSVRVPQPPSTLGMSSSIFPPNPNLGAQPPASTSTPIGISFSSNSSSTSPSTEDDDDEFEGEPSNTAGSSRKRKRQSSSKGGSSSTHRMMDFFEGLIKQVMQKQESMQQRFLEAIEKREQDRMIREEAWKRQEMARVSREHEHKTQERAISASRDAAIISFLQNITGQTIHLPAPLVNIPSVPPQPVPMPVAQVAPMPTPLPPPPPPQQPLSLPQQQHQQQQGHRHRQSQPPISSEIVMAIPEQQVAPQDMDTSGGGSLEATSSRWPKTEVLALINIRSGLESRYQEAGPKGPLWEEISAGMVRMGYKRNPKRCKEKWENINKYFKKVKESNKKRPEDGKTCPYFHQLDALYRKKVLGSSSTGDGGGTSSTQSQPQPQPQPPQQQQQESINLNPIPPTNPSDVPAIVPAPQLTQTSESENKNGASDDVFGEASAAKKPEDIVKELMEQHQQRQALIVEDEYDKIEELDSDNIDQEEDEDEDDDEDDEELEEESKMAYKIEFQRQNTSTSNGGGNGAASFLAMVQ